MKETYEYILTDMENELFNVKCRVEYNTKNAYDTNYYFFDGDNWHKDFIDLNKLSPESREDKDKFEDFVTRMHDYMVHDNFWDELKSIDNEDILTKKQYNLIITAKKV